MRFLAPEGRSTLTAPGETPLQQPWVDIAEYPLGQFRTELHYEATSRLRANGPLHWIQSLFLLVGLVSAGTYGWLYGEARVYQAYQSWRLNQIMKHRPANLRAFLASYLAGSATEVTKEPPAPVNGSAEPSPSPPPAPLAVGALIGRIEIPRLGLSTVVLEGDSDQVLRKGVGHIPSTSLPGGSGNVAIAGHRDTFFRALKDIREDDNITLATTAGTYHYRVGSVQVVTPDNTQVLAPSDQASLTLVTCYPFHFVGSAPKRYIVHAQQIGSSRAVKQSLCQTQPGPTLDDGAESCPSAVTVPPRPEPGLDIDRPSSGDRPDPGTGPMDDGNGVGMARNPVLYRLKTTLRDIYPPIWRRMQVWESATLAQLQKERDWFNAQIAAALESYMDGDD
jgi:sortase A